MKLLIPLLMLTSCVTYQNFVQVDNRTDIPNGVKEFTVSMEIEAAKQILAANYIAYKTHELGLETEEILLDEGTRAVYKIYRADPDRINVVPYWGLTEKSKMAVTLSSDAAGSYSPGSGLTRIIYSREQERQKKVYDYGVQLFAPGGQITHVNAPGGMQ